MNITQAIEIGYAKVGKQITNAYFDFDANNKICGACALGCALLGVNETVSEEELSQMEDSELDDVVWNVLYEHGWVALKPDIEYMNDEENLTIPEIIKRLEIEQ